MTVPGPLTRELLAPIERLSTQLRLPRVRAVHLPRPECLDTRHGEFCALELDDGTLGLAFVLLGDTHARLSAPDGAAALAGADALALARRYEGADPVERTVAMAALNALSRFVLDRVGYMPAPSADSIGELDPRAGDRVGMVGLFRPLLARCIATGAEVVVVELRADLAGQHEGYRVTLDASELGRCNKVLCTSSVLINGTAERMLGHCARAERVAMIGPGAGCLPDALFARGVTLFGGSWVTDPAGVIDALRAGEPWSDCARKFAIRRDEYPGIARLAAEALHLDARQFDALPLDLGRPPA